MKPSIATLFAGEYSSYLEGVMLIDNDWFSINAEVPELSIAGYTPNPKYGAHNKPVEKFKFPNNKNVRFFKSRFSGGAAKAPKPMSWDFIITPEAIVDMLIKSKRYSRMSIRKLNDIYAYDLFEQQAKEVYMRDHTAIFNKDFMVGFDIRWINDYCAKPTIYYFENSKLSNVFTRDLKSYFTKDTVVEAAMGVEERFGIKLTGYENYIDEVRKKAAEVCIRPIILTYDIPDYYIKIGFIYRNGEYRRVIGLANKETYKFVEDMSDPHSHEQFIAIPINNPADIRKVIDQYFSYYDIGTCHQSLIDMVSKWWDSTKDIIKELP